MKLALLFGAALLAAGTALHAQTGDKPAKKPASPEERRARAERLCEGTKKRMEKADFSKAQATYRECMQRELCAREKDKAACGERVAKAFSTEEKARRACAGSKGKEPAYQDCMRRERCAGTKDPVRCEARVRANEVCAPLKGKGDAHRDCLQREVCSAFAADPARCQGVSKVREACKGKKGDARRACMQEQRGKKK